MLISYESYVQPMIWTRQERVHSHQINFYGTKQAFTDFMVKIKNCKFSHLTKKIIKYPRPKKGVPFATKSPQQSFQSRGPP